MTARFPPIDSGGSGVGYYLYTQGTPAANWTITHNLGFHPDIQVFDSAGDQVEGDVTHVSINEITVHFSAAFSGWAYLN